MKLAELRAVSRDTPLKPQGLIARQDLGRKLAQRLSQDLRRGLRDPRQIRGLYFPQGIILLGEEEHLPWLPGVEYLGKPDAGGRHYYLCLMQCEVHDVLIDRALCREYPEASLFFDCQRHQVFDLSPARSIDEAGLQEYLRGTA